MGNGFAQTRAGVVAQFVLLALAWGSSFLLIKIGLHDLSPTQIVWARMIIGAVALGLLLLATHRPIPRDWRIWGHLAVVSVLLCLVPFTLFAWAEQYVSSALASIFNATTPLITMLVAALAIQSEQLTRHRCLGLGLGFVGVVIIIGPWNGTGEAASLAGQLACLGATTCYALAFTYLRRFVAGRGLSSSPLAFVQVLLGAVMMVAATPWVADQPIDHLSGATIISMLILGAFGTGMAYVWNNNIVEAWGAANGAAVTYLSPVVGVALGSLILNEPLTWHQPLGAVLVILGIMAAHGRLTGTSARLARRKTQPQAVGKSNPL